MAALPHPLDLSIRQVRRGVQIAGTLFGDHILHDLANEKDFEASLRSALVSNMTMAQALRSAWAVGWKHGTDKILRRIAKRHRVTMPRIQVHTLAAEPGGYVTPAPFTWPGSPRLYDPTNPVPRATWEHLAEHEQRLADYVPRAYVDRYIDRRAGELAGKVDAVLIDIYRDRMAAITERGFGLREAMTTLRRDLPQFSDWRLENIARTEGASAYSIGQASKYVADGLVQGWQWDAILDGRTSEICENLNGRCWKDDDPNAQAPPAHYQCRSTIEPILFNETGINWETGPLTGDAVPLEGFGDIDRDLLPPRESADDLFSQLSRQTGGHVAIPERVPIETAPTTRIPVAVEAPPAAETSVGVEPRATEVPLIRRINNASD